MNKESFALIGIKLIAIYLIANGLVFLPNLPQLWMGPTPDSYMILGYSLAFLAPLIIGVILYIVSMHLTKYICKESYSNQISNADIKINELHGVILSVAGLMVVVMKLPGFINVILRIKQTAIMNERQAEYFSNLYFLSELMILVLGAALFFGAKFWVNLYGWFQRFGLENK